MKQKILKKLKNEIAGGTKVELLPKQKYRQEIIKVGKIIIFKDHITVGNGNSHWEWFIYLDFIQGAILSNQDEIKEIVKFILDGQENLADKYLNEIHDHFELPY